MAVDPSRSSPAAAVPSPAASADQEIRFAVVMYGGISLAIYMHGVAQELLRLVRSTSGANVQNDEVTKIYEDLSRHIRDQSDPNGQPVQTRFVIDILSGTSAGGINAVFLAKALALRSQDLEPLRRTWLDMANIDEIFNRPTPRKSKGPGWMEPKRSLLDGGWMYEQLYQAFADMNDGPVDDYVPVERVDLFATTTDLNGVWVPIRLADMNVNEKVHKGVFNFRLDSIALAEGSHPDPLDVELDRLRRNDFAPQWDAMLAFACRCTSSFPIAFAPMKLADIEAVMGTDDYTSRKETYRGLFRWIPRPPLVKPQNPVSIEERELADGGYLDNKPFDCAINALAFRATALRHTRKLLFIDPFPEIAADTTDQPHFDFLENAVAGSMTLPHYQTIREEIDRVQASNRIQARLQILQDRTMTASRPAPFGVAPVVALVNQYGSMYGAYHVVRLLGCADDLARMFGALPSQSEDSLLAVRYLVRAWFDDTYAPNRTPGKQLETQFFADFDFSFRMRRAAHLLEWAQSREHRNPALCELLVRHLTRLQRRREQLSLSGDANPIWPSIEALGTVVTLESIKWILEPIPDDERMARAGEIYAANADKFRTMAGDLARCWAQVFELNRRELGAMRAGDEFLDYRYQYFDYHDMVSLVFLEGSDVSEHTETEIYRISPADGIQRPLDQKLAGYAVQAFGAFLKREWRENDILWGRLDACERIVSAVLTHRNDRALRDEFVSRLQNAIVQQEADLRRRRDGRRARDRADDLTLAVEAIKRNRLRDYLTNQYVLPEGPKPSDSARRIAYAADIFGRMIEDDVGKKNRLTGLLRSAGGLAAQLVGLVTPGTIGRVFLNYWLALIMLAAGLLLAYAWIAGDDHARILGARGLGAAVLAWVFSKIIGGQLARPGVPVWIRPLRWLPAIVFVLLVWIGWRHLPQDAHDWWQHMWHAARSP